MKYLFFITIFSFLFVSPLYAQENFGKPFLDGSEGFDEQSSKEIGFPKGNTISELPEGFGLTALRAVIGFAALISFIILILAAILHFSSSGNESVLASTIYWMIVGGIGLGVSLIVHFIVAIFVT